MSDPQPMDEIVSPRLSESQLATLAPLATRRSFRDGESLFQAGSKRGGFFIVLSGAIEIIDRAGETPRTIAVHGPGEFTGDIDILSRRRPVVGARARGDTEVLEIAPAEIRRVIGEKPAIGEVLLRAFIARREMLLESGYQGLRVIGSGRSRDAYRVREFLTRNQVPVTWIDVDEEPGVGELLRHFGLTESDLPAVVFGDQPLMRNPSSRELAETIGIKRPVGTVIYDLVIIGAGPAGLAAAVYASSEGLRTLVLDASAPGGQASTSMRIENYLGFPTGITGAELTGKATIQAQKFGARLTAPSRVSALENGGSRLFVHTDDGERATARCVLIATGADYRKLDVPERERFEGLGVYYAATPTELAACAGSEVVIVGAGNSAGQAAMYMADNTRRVVMVVRGDDLRRNMSSYLAERIEGTRNIDLRFDSEIRRLEGGERLERVVVENTRTGESRTVVTPALFTFIGAVPRTDWLPDRLDTDAKGFIRTGRALSGSPPWPLDRAPYMLETSLPGVFAAGDVRSGSAKRVASAVGEGSMAVKFVHEYLADAPS